MASLCDAMVTLGGKVAMGLPQTDLEDIQSHAHFDHVVGFEDEVGMIHSIAHYFEHFGIRQGTVGLEYAFLPQPRMVCSLIPCQAEAVGTKTARYYVGTASVKVDDEIERIGSSKVAEAGMRAR